MGNRRLPALANPTVQCRDEVAIPLHRWLACKLLREWAERQVAKVNCASRGRQGGASDVGNNPRPGVGHVAAGFLLVFSSPDNLTIASAPVHDDVATDPPALSQDPDQDIGGRQVLPVDRPGGKRRAVDGDCGGSCIF